MNRRKQKRKVLYFRVSPRKEQREQGGTRVHRNKPSAGVCRGRPVADPNLTAGRSAPMLSQSRRSSSGEATPMQ